MGSTITICNKTNLILNIALAQLTPLYYENQVLPGECMSRNVGKVWFTIEAAAWTGDDSEYKDWHNILPLTLIGVGVVTTVITGGIGAAAAPAWAGIGGTAAGAAGSVLTGTIGTTIGSSLIVTGMTCPKDYKPETLMVSSAGWYMGSDRTLYIRGGPDNVELYTEGGKTKQKVDFSKYSRAVYVSD